MAKTKSLSKEQKYERQKLLSAERVRRFRESMTEEQWEEKRKKERERYRKKKEQNQIKSINELSDQEKREKQKVWRTNSKTYRQRKKNQDCPQSRITPSPSDNETVVSESVQKQQGQGYINRWKNLRDGYVKYMKQRAKNGPGTVQKRRKRYGLAKRLSFLKEVIVPSQKPLNIEFMKVEMNETSEDQQDSLSLGDCDDTNVSSLSMHNEEVEGSYIEGRNETDDTTNSDLLFLRRNETDENTNSDLLFFRSMLDIIKPLSMNQKINFRIDVMRLALEYADQCTNDVPLSLPEGPQAGDDQEVCLEVQ